MRSDLDENNATNSFDAGVAAHLRGVKAQAEAHYRHALELDPGHAEALNNLGVLLDETDRPEEAETCYRRAVSLRPDYIDALRNLGARLRDTQRWSEAEDVFRKALAFDPAHAATHLQLANLLHRAGRTIDAANSLRHAAALQPDTIQIGFELGLLLETAGQLTEAETLYRKTIGVQPDRADAHIALARVLSTRQNVADAERHYREALRLTPDDVNARCGLGSLLHSAGRHQEGEACLREATSRKPDHVLAWGNLACLLNETARYEEAEACYRRILQIDPKCVEALHNLASLLEGAHRLDEAEPYYRQVLAIDPERVPTILNLSLLLLKAGRLAQAWPLYESRYAASRYWGDEAAAHAKPDFPFSEWQGESLSGRSLLVQLEQGFGDSLQFARYFSMLKGRGLAQLSVICPAALTGLFEQIESIDTLIAPENVHALPSHDFWTTTMSLPLRFDTTLDNIPASVPYLRAPADRLARWSGRLLRDARDAPKVGLVWAGDPRPSLASAHRTDRRRSLHARACLPLLRVPGVNFVSLQMGASTRPQINEIPPELRPVDLMDEASDFADTAALIEQLDLVITVDTSVAHLAGALGKPVWILSRFDGCWRWLLDRDDSPWYPTARLFRQPQRGDWTSVIDRVADALRTWAAQAR